MTSTTPMSESASREKALQFLYRRVDFERMQSIPYGTHEFKLDRMKELLARLEHPHARFPILHVAGTKGKGSTSAAIAAILSAAGYRTGLFTSPHLQRIEERLAIDGRICEPQSFVDLVRQVQPIVEAMDRGQFGGSADHPTFFEIITAVALLYFAAQRVDVAVLEVGLGGRLDSTNVCQPCVSVITSISFDHTQQLGHTLELIAAEKAGIVKPGVPVISGVTEDGPRQVIRAACRRHGSPLVELGQDFRFTYLPAQHLEQGPSPALLTFVEDDHVIFDAVALALIGRHQAANATLAVAAVRQLQHTGWNISEAAVHTALSRLSWPARVEVVGRRPTIVVDTAHNVASVQALLEALDESFSARRRRLLFATTREKDASGMLRLLLERFDDVILTRYSNNPRAVPPAELAAMGLELTGRACPVCENPVEAWKQLVRRSASDDLLCVTGSFFIAAEIRKLTVADA